MRLTATTGGDLLGFYFIVMAPLASLTERNSWRRAGLSVAR